MTKRQKQKAPEKRLSRKLLYSVVVVTLILVASLVTYYLVFQPHMESWTAALIDQVTIENLGNQEFNANVTSVLNASGFDVKYYPGNDVTVDFYKALPSKGSKIIILRAHSAVRNQTEFVDLFTSESFVEGKYSTYGNQISRATFLIPPYNEYFAIGPTFVDSTVRGRFDGSVVILMGCSSLAKTSMAAALVNRGAKIVIGWTKDVLLDDSDNSTSELLQYLLVHKNNVADAVSKINQSPHPLGTTLDYYPKTAGNYIVPTKKSETPQALKVGLFESFALTTLPNRKPSSMDAFFD